MRESGVTKEHLARVVVKNRANGADNPNAMYQHDDDGRRRARVAGRVRAAAPAHAVLAERGCGRGRRAARGPTGSSGAGGVRIAGGALRSHLPGSVLGEATPMSGIDDVDITPPSTLAAEAAYEEAGLGPDDLDVVECQDTDAARELLGYEELAPVRAGRVGRAARVAAPPNRAAGCR